MAISGKNKIAIILYISGMVAAWSYQLRLGLRGELMANRERIQMLRKYK